MRSIGDKAVIQDGVSRAVVVAGRITQAIRSSAQQVSQELGVGLVMQTSAWKSAAAELDASSTRTLLPALQRAVVFTTVTPPDVTSEVKGS